jgi:hypothetical protein
VQRRACSWLTMVVLWSHLGAAAPSGRPSACAACGGNLGLPWLPRSVAPEGAVLLPRPDNEQDPGMV